jgi:hypothetical protein
MNVDWLQVLVMVFGNAAWILPMFFWVRAESRSDIRHMDNQMNAIRNLIDEMRKDTMNFRKEWMEESKSFHARLCEIEANRHKAP